MADDPVAAFLDEVSLRAYRASLAGFAPRTAAGELVAASAEDVGPLYLAVQAVLALHKPEGFSIDAQGRKRVTCWQGKCRDEGWPCAEYRTISSALLGDGGNDG